MTNNSTSAQAGHRDAMEPESQSLISGRSLAVASLLGLLSLIDEWQVSESLTITGGTTLIALAAVVLLWPIVRQVAVRGGEIDLKGLRLKVNQIENEAQRIENDNAMRIQELESELDELRGQGTLASRDDGADAASESRTPGDDTSVLEWAVESYRTAVPKKDFRKRVEIDKEIIRRGRHLSLEALRGFLDSQSWSSESQMAVAVALGLSPPREEEIGRADLLVELISSGNERVRARAAQAAKRWGERRVTSKISRSELLRSTESRLLEESPSSGARGYLEKAQQVLSATQDWSEA